MMDDYSYQEGGSDMFSSEGGYLLITENETGVQYTANTIDFVIDETGNGIVYFDGNMQFELPGASDYAVLEDMFYTEFSVQEM